MPEKTSLNLQQVQGIKSVVPSNGSTTSSTSTTLDNSNFQTSFMKEVAQAKKGQYRTVQYSTVQYSTVQYSTVQYSTVQYSTVLSTHNFYLLFIVLLSVQAENLGQ